MNLIREAMSRLPGHWHKGSMGDGNEAMKMMHDKAFEMFPNDYLGFGDFNDDPNVTEEDVLAVMEKAAIALEEKV